MTTLVDELLEAAKVADECAADRPICSAIHAYHRAQAARLRERAARVREEEREHVNRSHDARAMLMRIAGPDLGGGKL